jgi:ATP-dependent 26S proteasome regulatory subunit
MIEFENPGVEERERLWQTYLPGSLKTDDRISIPDIAQKYELTGANIVNVIHYAGLQMMRKGMDMLTYADLSEGIRREFRKEGRIFRDDVR